MITVDTLCTLHLLFRRLYSDERMLWIHAGPHKAASSYVTERVRKNRAALATQRVLMDGDNNLLAIPSLNKIINL